MQSFCCWYTDIEGGAEARSEESRNQFCGSQGLGIEGSRGVVFLVFQSTLQFLTSLFSLFLLLSMLLSLLIDEDKVCFPVQHSTISPFCQQSCLVLLKSFRQALSKPKIVTSSCQQNSILFTALLVVFVNLYLSHLHTLSL